MEVRLGHRSLFELSLAFVGVSREARGSVIQLLSTASAASPLHATARSKRWPSIKAGLEGIGLSAEAIGRCRQLVLQVRCGWRGGQRARGHAWVDAGCTQACCCQGGAYEACAGPHACVCRRRGRPRRRCSACARCSPTRRRGGSMAAVSALGRGPTRPLRRWHAWTSCRACCSTCRWAAGWRAPAGCKLACAGWLPLAAALVRVLGWRACWAGPALPACHPAGHHCHGRQQ